MSKAKIENEQFNPRWAISLDWFQQNNRSLSTLIGDYLCPQCVKKLSSSKKKVTHEVQMAAIERCCARAPGFINEHQPVLESAFRLFLANGNQPLDVEQLGSQLSEFRDGDYYRTSPDMLSHLLINDRHYGLRQLED